MFMRKQHTNAHNYQETSAELSEIYNNISAALHEIIGVGASSADPVWYRGEDVGCNNEKWEILFKQSAREDD